MAAIASTNPREVIGANNPPADPYDAIAEEINDLYDTAKDFCDGEPIATQEMHDTIEKLHDSLHEAGKRAEAMRVAEKKPLDDLVAAVQEKWNPLVQPKKGRVAMGKDACAALLLPWRKKIADEKAAVVAAARAEAERLAEAARAAHQAAADKGNLEATEAAELLIKEAAAVNRFAKAQEKGPSGLRSVWKAELVDEGAALDWCFGRDPDAFRALCQSQADAVVRAGVRAVPGFRVFETWVAS